jgi:hypothetical protein
MKYGLVSCVGALGHGDRYFAAKLSRKTLG